MKKLNMCLIDAQKNGAPKSTSFRINLYLPESISAIMLVSHEGLGSATVVDGTTSSTSSSMSWFKGFVLTGLLRGSLGLGV
jgi:hypothetical protein